MIYFYYDTGAIKKLEEERDSLIATFNINLINKEDLIVVFLVGSRTEKIIDYDITKYEINASNMEEIVARFQLEIESKIGIVSISRITTPC